MSVGNTAGKKKRRIDDRLYLEVEAGRKIGSHFAAVLRYNAERNMSSVDGTVEQLDYIDWNYGRYLFELSLRILY